MSNERRTPDLSERQVNGLIRSFLREEWHEDANRVASTVLDELDATPQRRSMWSAWRFPMNNTVRYALAAAAVVVVALIGYQLLIAPNVGAPNPSPSPDPSASAEASPASASLDGVPVAPIGLLEPGTYLAEFDPPFRFTVPAGWQRTVRAQPEWYILQPVALASTGAWIMVCRDTQAVDAINHVVPGIGTDAAAITTYVSQRTDLRNVAETHALDLGGLDGYWLDFDGPPLPPGEDITEVAVVGPGPCGTNAYDRQATRLGVFDIPGGGNVLVVIASPPGDHGVIDVGTPIVESFAFELE